MIRTIANKLQLSTALVLVAGIAGLVYLAHIKTSAETIVAFGVAFAGLTASMRQLVGTNKEVETPGPNSNKEIEK
jgi:hypothetical protein